MKTILVTGGAGFIGSCFVRRAIAAGVAADGPGGQAADGPRGQAAAQKATWPGGPVRVVNLDKLTYAGHLESLDFAQNHSLHQFVSGDVQDRKLLDELFQNGRPEAVVHFAAESHVDRSIDGPGEFLRTNIWGAYQLLEAAREYFGRLPDEAKNRFRFLHISTDEVFGSLGPQGEFTEESPCRPNSPYAASKAAADHLVRAWGNTFGLPVLTIHCSNNYGPYQFPEKLIPRLIHRALLGKPLPIFGDGKQVRDWIYVEDHSRAIERVLAAGHPGEVYNVGGDNQRTNLEVAQMLCELIDELAPNLPHRPCRELISFVEDRPGHDRRYAVDTAKIRRELNWRPEMDFEQGLRETVLWYLANQDWVRQIQENVGRRRNHSSAEQANIETAYL